MGPLVKPPAKAPRAPVIARMPNTFPRSFSLADSPARMLISVNPTPPRNQTVAVSAASCQILAARPINHTVGMAATPVMMNITFLR